MITELPRRAVVEITGEDRVVFLQGLVSNDVNQAAPGRAVWAALLTPQGKYLADFFIWSQAERLLLDCDGSQAGLVAARLGRLRLRSRVRIHDGSADWRVYAAWGAPPEVPDGAIAAPDPRLDAAGWRLLSPAPIATDATFAAWDAHRIALGLPDGARDLIADKTVLLEAGFDELNGVSWTKGCYMGQELTARTKYRGLIKRRLVPVVVEGPMPPAGTPILAGGREVGVIHDGQGDHAMATLRLDALELPLTCAEVQVFAALPGWMTLRLG